MSLCETSDHFKVPTRSSIAPTAISNHHIPELFEKYVQNTYSRYPITIVSGQGCTLKDSNDNIYLDFVSGIATCALGHSNPTFTKRIIEQLQSLHHCSNLYFIPAQAKLANWLVQHSVADKIFFCNSGAEANEAAIKLARRYAYNHKITDPVIITAFQSFHGRTLAALSATGQSKYHRGYTYAGEMVQGFQHVTYNDQEALVNMVKEMNVTPWKDKMLGRKRGVAAILLEALQGEGGIIPGNPEYFELARQLCDSCNALLMCDEVQVGMGRTGTLWGYEQLNIEPDVFTSAKALGGGVPIGAMCANEKAANVFGPGDHASTYGGNPLACAAGLAVAQYFSDHNLLTNVSERGEQLSLGLESIAQHYPLICAQVRGWGLLKGVQINDDSNVTASELVLDAMKEGLLLVPAGPNVVRFVPPLVVSKEEVDECLDIFEKVVANRAQLVFSMKYMNTLES